VHFVTILSHLSLGVTVTKNVELYLKRYLTPGLLNYRCD